MMRPRLPTALALLSLIAGLSVAAPARAADPGVQKPVKTLISAVRYGKDDLALKHLSGETQGRLLLEDEWDKGTPAQRQEFVQLFHRLFAGIAFPKIRESFEHLETILYDSPKLDGDKATLDSTLVILHPLKKQELKVRYDLEKAKDGWKVVDVAILGTGGNSFLVDIRNDQVRPIFGEGGWDHLLSLMRERAKQVEAAKK